MPFSTGLNPTNSPIPIKVDADGAVCFTGADGGSINGGAKVADVYQPARDIFVNWHFGADDTYETLTASTANDGLWIEISQLSIDHRSIVIECEGTTNYTYSVQFSRNGNDADAYDVVPTTAAVTTSFEQRLLPDTLGYDLYAKLIITPTGTGTALNFKAYLVGRGG